MTKAEFLYQIALIAHAQGAGGNNYKPFCLRYIAEANFVQAIDPENPRTAEYVVNEKHVREIIPDDVYSEIEYIYTYHPAIPDAYGKKYIAQLFCMGLLSGESRAHFLAEAEEAQRKEEATRKLRSQINELQRSLGAAQRKLHELETELENIA